MNDTVGVNRQEKIFVTYYLIKLITTRLCNVVLLNLLFNPIYLLYCNYIYLYVYMVYACMLCVCPC